VKSQDEMLRRRGNAESIGNTSAIEEAFSALNRVNQWLAGKSNVKVHACIIIAFCASRNRWPKKWPHSWDAPRHRSHGSASGWKLYRNRLK